MMCRPIFDRIDEHLMWRGGPVTNGLVIHPDDVRLENGELSQVLMEKLARHYTGYSFKLLGLNIHFGEPKTDA